MLVEFSVGNYRSFLERQTFSMVAGRGSKHAFSSDDKAAPHLLRTAALYGPNASGKSNFVKALYFFSAFVMNSAKESQDGEKIDVTPFKLTKKSLQEPCEFEVVFIVEGTRYQYGFSVTEKRVCEEWLFAVPPGGRTQKWFERAYNEDSDSYDWYINPTLKGKREVWRQSTRDNALFLSTAVQLKSESLKEVFSWIRDSLQIIGSPGKLSHLYSADKCFEDDWEDKILNFLIAADLGISKVVVKKNKVTSEDIPDDVLEEIKIQLLGKKYFDVFTVHMDEDGDDVLFSIDDESDGTKFLFALAGPWLDVLENGLVLIVDELHNSLHPHMLRFLVNMFNDDETNKKNAQLIFTSHDTSLMYGDYLGRDQFWLAEKTNNSTELYPLLDFKPRNGEVLERGYLGGRYGALPKIKELT